MFDEYYTLCPWNFSLINPYCPCQILDILQDQPQCFLSWHPSTSYYYYFFWIFIVISISFKRVHPISPFTIFIFDLRGQASLKLTFFFNTYFKLFNVLIFILSLKLFLFFSYTRGMWDLSSPTRDWACTPCAGPRSPKLTLSSWRDAL